MSIVSHRTPQLMNMLQRLALFRATARYVIQYLVAWFIGALGKVSWKYLAALN